MRFSAFYRNWNFSVYHFRINYKQQKWLIFKFPISLRWSTSSLRLRECSASLCRSNSCSLCLIYTLPKEGNCPNLTCQVCLASFSSHEVILIFILGTCLNKMTEKSFFSCEGLNFLTHLFSYQLIVFNSNPSVGRSIARNRKYSFWHILLKI